MFYTNVTLHDGGVCVFHIVQTIRCSRLLYLVVHIDPGMIGTEQKMSVTLRQIRA